MLKHGQSDVVLFENFEKSHSSVIDVISTLTMTGLYTLSSRYLLQNNILVESTGMLANNSISELSANGKFFVFTYEKSDQEVFNVFGSKFMGAIGDILHTTTFDEVELQKLVLLILSTLKNKCSRQLSVSIEWDETVLNAIVSEYKVLSGFIGLELFVNDQLFKPLAEYKLRNSINKIELLFITYTSEGFESSNECE